MSGLAGLIASVQPECFIGSRGRRLDPQNGGICRQPMCSSNPPTIARNQAAT